MMIIIKRASLLIVSFLLFSCNEISQSIQQTINPDVKEEAMPQSGTLPIKSTVSKGSLANDVNALQEAENSLRDLPQFKDHELFVFRSAHFYPDGRISLNIQNPLDPDQVDRYTYKNGEWEDSEPVRITKSDQVQEYLISLDKTPFVRANKVYEVIREKMKEIDSGEEDVTVYFAPFKGTVRWYPSNLRTDRSSYALSFDQEGNLLSFEQQ